MTFGEYLKQLREAKQWTQPDAAAKAGIEQSYLSKLETGKSYPSEDVFARLVDVFQISTAKLTNAVSAQELAKLNEISTIRSFLLDRATKIHLASRAWLLAGLAMLMMSGASFGFTKIGNDYYRNLNIYKSVGVLKPGEPLKTFNDLTRRVSGTGQAVEAFEQRKSELTERIDEHEIISATGRGDFFVVNTPDGRRFYEFDRYEHESGSSPLRWFIIPALAFLFGAIGSFLISFRWR